MRFNCVPSFIRPSPTPRGGCVGAGALLARGAMRRAVLGMRAAPLSHQLLHPLGKLSSEHLAEADLHDGSILPILSVEVRWIVVIVEHLDQCSEKGGHNRHAQPRLTLSARQEITSHSSAARGWMV